MIDDIADKRVVHRVLEHRLRQTATDEFRAAIQTAVANHSIISWEHINLLGEYDFSDEKLRDLGRHPTQKNHPESASSKRGKETRVNSWS